MRKNGIANRSTRDKRIYDRGHRLFHMGLSISFKEKKYIYRNGQTYLSISFDDMLTKTDAEFAEFCSTITKAKNTQ